MVFIPGGEFPQGRTQPLPDDDLKWFPDLLKDDRPVRPVRVAPFYLDTHEVTNRDYAAFVEATGAKSPYHWKGREPSPNHPVANVTWEEAKSYCEWAGKRLPTEAEWERAARGIAEGSKYPWGNRKPTKDDAHYGSVNGPVDVCRYPTNYFGLCDMAGNVWEWTADFYARDYYQTGPADNPRGPASGLYHVLRGGSWADTTKYLTCAYRSWARPTERSPNIGFRCARNYR